MINVIRSCFGAMPPLFWLLAGQASLEAQLSPSDRREAEKMVAGTYYLRLDVPCDYSRMVPMLDVSPEGASSNRIGDLSPADRENVYWLLGPNDTVSHITLRWGYNSVRLWGEGLGSKRNEVMIDFLRLKGLDDFRKAFDRTFSRTPLQDAHPEWPPDVRKAISERRLVEGMTREQAAAVIGQPMSVESTSVAGQEAETWRLRQVRVGKRGDWGVRIQNGFPASLKFQGGRLAVIEPAQSPPSQPGKK